MASHSLAIAKASFAASLMRPDPTTIPRPEVAQFHDHFDALLKQCSSLNIQLCKDWLLKNITHSKTRTVALGKYFAATCVSLVKGQPTADAKLHEEDGPPPRRRQLHILYLLHDLLHHVKFHAESPAAKITLVESLPSSLLEILQSASAHTVEAFPKHHKKVYELLDLWAQQEFFPSTYLQKLRDTATYAEKASKGDEGNTGPLSQGVEDSGRSKRDVPYVMPPSHGDPSIPFYDLPAGNMMPLIIPNSTAPINPQSMKPLQFMIGPADAKLAAAVDDFLRGVDTLDVVGITESEDAKNDFDELGQSLLRDAITGEILESDGYYGWSRAFCEKMKNGGDIRGFDNEVARDESRSRSRSPRKRRRYSTSESYSSVDRDRSRSRSYSRSIERQRSRSISATRSRSPPSDPRLQRSGPAYEQPSSSILLQPQGPPPLPPPPFTQGYPLGPGGVPIPPRPAGYNGPWPPPPPPPIPEAQGTISSAFGPGGHMLPHQGAWGQQLPAPTQIGWAQRMQSPIQAHASPYEMPVQGQPTQTSYSNSHQAGTSKSYKRGGWNR